MKAFHSPQGNKKTYFTRAQQAARKDVERAFGVLQSRFAMVRGPARLWSKEDLWYIMQCCVLLHNMIVEDEREEPDDCNYDQEPNGIRVLNPKDYEHRDPLLLNDFLKIHEEIEDRSSHERLRDDRVEHLWARYNAR